MTRLCDIATKIRSKNAGPFWLTVDVFCADTASFERLRTGLASSAVAAAFAIDEREIRRFDIAGLRVIKFSLPRPFVQGMRADRDMHGASYAQLLAGLDIAEPGNGAAASGR